MRFEGKRGLVLGVANRRSIAWAIAQRLADEGATLAFTFQGERIEGNVRELAADRRRARSSRRCDVRSDDDLARVFSEKAETRSAEGSTSSSTRSPSRLPRISRAASSTRRATGSGWRSTSARTRFVACARAAEPLMETRGRRLDRHDDLPRRRARRAALQRHGCRQGRRSTASVRYLAWDLGFKNIRVNAISAGPVRTLAARSIAGFTTMQAMFEERAPLHRQIESDDVRRRCGYLLSDEAANVSGTTLYVDAGYHAMGM